MNRLLSKPLLALLLGGMLAVFATGCSRQETAEVPSPARVTGLEVIRLDLVNIPDTVEAVGTVRATQTALLSAQVMGRIVEMRALEGAQVRKGEILVVLEDSLYRASVTQAEAGLLVAQGDIGAAESQLELATATL